MPSVFDEVANALAAVLQTSIESAGFILGMITIFGFLLVFLIISSVVESEFGWGGFVIGTGIGVMFSTLVGWFPVWVAIFMALLITFVVVAPWGRE